MKVIPNGPTGITSWVGEYPRDRFSKDPNRTLASLMALLLLDDLPNISPYRAVQLLLIQ